MKHVHIIAVSVIGFFAVSAANPPSPQAAELAASQNVMQCMAQCIKHEGNTATARDTCKPRCADVKAPAATRGNRDCMAIYKKCNRGCPKSDKTCRRTCKSSLMQCK